MRERGPRAGWSAFEFDLIVRPFPHPIVVQQVSAPQPKLLMVILSFMVAAWLPTGLSYLLMLWPPFSHLVTQHRSPLTRSSTASRAVSTST
jgi:hypothetical protein